jgi:S-adenosylmethionine:tRNA-ribosyltransferase-isomerase (queuine synthetase)
MLSGTRVQIIATQPIVSNRSSNITNLSFHNSHIDNNKLCNLSDDFHELDNLVFDDCTFFSPRIDDDNSDDDHINEVALKKKIIIMIIHGAVKKMKVYMSDEIIQSTRFLFGIAGAMQQNTMKDGSYYIEVDSEASSCKNITKKRYNKLRDEDTMGVYYYSTKTINSFTFTAKTKHGIKQSKFLSSIQFFLRINLLVVVLML